LIRLRRLLRPLRPILRPIWRRLQPFVSPDERRSLPNLIDRAQGRLEHLGRNFRDRPEPPIRPLRQSELAELAAAEPYYKARRVYMSVAGRVARDLIRRKNLRTALELGPHLRPLIVGADVMDILHNDGLRAEGARVVHDATKTPWPFLDKSYDLFVALQVFEHLGTSQPDAFREVRRVARNAILSLPIDWVMADPRNCHHGLTEERVLEWFAPVVPTRVVLGNAGHRKRLVFVFEDLPAPDVDVPAGGGAERAGSEPTAATPT